EPGLLYLVQHAVQGEALDGRDRLAGDRAHRDRAGAHRHAVDMDRAGAALRDAAAVFCPGEADRVTQCPKQWGVGLHIDIVGLAIDRQGWHSASSRFIAFEKQALSRSKSLAWAVTWLKLRASLALVEHLSGHFSGMQRGQICGERERAVGRPPPSYRGGFKTRPYGC